MTAKQQPNPPQLYRKTDAEILEEIDVFFTSPERRKFVQGLIEYFRHEEVVLILRIATESGVIT